MRSLLATAFKKEKRFGLALDTDAILAAADRAFQREMSYHAAVAGGEGEVAADAGKVSYKFSVGTGLLA